MAKLPAFQFYPGDWLKDPELRSCSPSARGLWIDMLCLMHESNRRGYLEHRTGNPVTTEQLARMTGCSVDEVSRGLQELDDAGVFSCTEDGVIYSRRVIRDEQIRQVRKQNGSKGGSKRPSKTQAKPKHSHGRPEGEVEDEERSGGDGGSGGKGREPPQADAPLPGTLNTEAFRSAWRDWAQHRRERRQPLTPTAASRALKKLERMGHDRAIEAIEHSVANGWQGIFEPQRAGGSGPSGESPAGAGQGGQAGRGGARPGEYPEDHKPLPRV